MKVLRKAQRAWRVADDADGADIADEQDKGIVNEPLTRRRGEFSHCHKKGFKAHQCRNAYPQS